jgi:hypothetical protein
MPERRKLCVINTKQKNFENRTNYVCRVGGGGEGGTFFTLGPVLKLLLFL